MTVLELHYEIEKVCPIHGVNSNGVIWFKDEATDEQKNQARSIMESWMNK